MSAPHLSLRGLMVLKLFVDNPSRELYGSQIMRMINLASGTIYPMLLQFERYGFLTSRMEMRDPEFLGRPQCRMYTITGAGLAFAREALAKLQ